MLFLSFATNLKFALTNNQYRTSSNLRTQATIQDGRVTVQNIQRRQSQGYGVNSKNSPATGTRGTNTINDVNANQSRRRCYLEEMDGCDDLKLHTTSNFKADHVDAYDSDCDDEATACAIFMASLSL
nr:hypothetical protein [Tanacetum cinerariifolium]